MVAEELDQPQRDAVPIMSADECAWAVRLHADWMTTTGARSLSLACEATVQLINGRQDGRA
jgi:hypothetical protein